MSRITFADTWERARRQRRQPHFALLQKLSQTPLERCSGDPARFKQHPACLAEIALLELTEDEFNAVQPEHAKLIEKDKPARTGVSWIDEAEAVLFASRER